MSASDLLRGQEMASPGHQLDPDLPVLILRLDHNVLHHGSLGAIRSLGRAGIEVHALLEGPGVPVARSRYLHRIHPWVGAGSRQAILNALSQSSEQIGRPALLMTLDDAGAVFVAEHQGALGENFLLPRLNADLPSLLADKASLAQLCNRLDIPHPDTHQPTDAHSAAEVVRILGLPLIAKWSRPWLLPRGAGLRSTTLVRSTDEAQRLVRILPIAGSQLLFQRRLPVGPGGDWFYHGYFDRDSRCLFQGTGVKERAWPPNAGLTAAGRWIANPTVEELALRLAKTLRYHGTLDLDLRLDPESGRYHLLDANPRLGAQFRLFTDATGLDVVRAQHLDLSGRPVPAARPRNGHALIVENYAVLNPPPITRATSAELAWYARDDPAPFLAMTGTFASHVIKRLATAASALARPRTGAPTSAAAPETDRGSPLRSSHALHAAPAAGTGLAQHHHNAPREPQT